MDDLLPRIQFRNLYTFREDRIELQEWTLKLIDRPFHLRQRDEWKSVAIQDRHPQVVFCPLTGICDNGFVLQGKQTIPSKAVFNQRTDYTFDLPRLAGTRREVFCPGQV